MIDLDTFLTVLYVMVDDFCKSKLPCETRPGPEASLSCSEVVTLAIVSQWGRFPSERGFYRYACRHLRSAFPKLPDRGQFNRLLRQHADAIVLFNQHLKKLLGVADAPYEALDGMAVRTRNAKRRGYGWLAGLTDIGWSNRLGWYEGFHLLTAVTPEGVISGFGFAPASTKDQPLAETFLAARRYANPRLASVGQPTGGPYVADKGFEGQANHQRWLDEYGAELICAPRQDSPHPWPKQLRRWLASIRQIVETVHDKLLHTFRLDRERPHALVGFQARLAASVALHNFCIWLNKQLGRPRLAFADLIDW